MLNGSASQEGSSTPLKRKVPFCRFGGAVPPSQGGPLRGSDRLLPRQRLIVDLLIVRYIATACPTAPRVGVLCIVYTDLRCEHDLLATPQRGGHPIKGCLGNGWSTTSVSIDVPARLDTVFALDRCLSYTVCSRLEWRADTKHWINDINLNLSSLSLALGSV